MSESKQGTWRPDVSLSAPAQLLVAVPHLVGYPPGDGQFVAVGLDGERVTVTAVMETQTLRMFGGAHLAVGLHRSGADAVLLVAYGDGATGTPVMDRLSSDLSGQFTIIDAIRVHQGRFWSYNCTNLLCCPVEAPPVAGDSDLADWHRQTVEGSVVEPIPDRRCTWGMLRGIWPEDGRRWVSH